MLWTNRSVSVDWIVLARALSAIGSYWGAPLVGVLLLGWQAVKRSEPAALAPFRFGVGFLVAMLLAWTAKAAFAMPRPSDLYANDMARVVGAADSLHAFPSGHAVYTAAVVACLWPLGSWPFRLLLLALAAAVGWSRVALGAHFPVDVVGGFLLGGACVAATHGWAASLKRAADGWGATR
ncbi:phosphatase PAP2 family protein [Caenimonas sedimenti]|uniref:Phosphatase PAP2 family protein n=2 Tax=Caenimonas sedimenti TaxID=2596921 RepID=A0A562ZDK4_9BURK|nr:phosphatase PAP2 family protein [Caenimonas sedimenti]